MRDRSNQLVLFRSHLLALAELMSNVNDDLVAAPDPESMSPKIFFALDHLLQMVKELDVMRLDFNKIPIIDEAVELADQFKDMNLLQVRVQKTLSQMNLENEKRAKLAHILAHSILNKGRRE